MSYIVQVQGKQTSNRKQNKFKCINFLLLKRHIFRVFHVVFEEVVSISNHLPDLRVTAIGKVTGLTGGKAEVTPISDLTMNLPLAGLNCKITAIPPPLPDAFA